MGEDVGRCRACGRELDTVGSAQSDVSLCLECAVDSAEATLNARKQASGANDAARHRSAGVLLRVTVIALLIVGASGVIAVQADDLVAALSGPKPIHAGDVETNSSADDCIESLWSAAALMQNGGDPSTLRCPATSEPFVVSTEGTLTIVACPNPDVHDAESLTVRSDQLVPEVVLP